jgi:transposase
MVIRHSAELKDQVVKEVIETGSTSIVARKHGVSPKTVHNWVRQIKNKDTEGEIQRP